MNTRSLVGKIARLPYAIRAQVNRRLHDGQTGPELLPWLNQLPAVQKMLADQFDGKPITHRNLTNWRATGYQHWLEEQKPFLLLKEHSRDARQFARAARGLASGAAALAADKLFQSIRSGEINSTDELLKILPSILGLLKADHRQAQHKPAKCKVRQRDAHLLLLRDKHQRDIAAITLRVAGDERIKHIEAAPCNYEEKLELLGRHMFGDLWQPRLLPVPPEPPSSSSPSSSSSKKENPSSSAPAASELATASEDGSTSSRSSGRESALTSSLSSSSSSSSSKNENSAVPSVPSVLHTMQSMAFPHPIAFHLPSLAEGEILKP